MQRNPSEKLWAGLKLTELKQALQEIYGLDFRTVAESQKLNFRTTTTGRILDTQSEFDVLSDFRRPDSSSQLQDWIKHHRVLLISLHPKHGDSSGLVDLRARSGCVLSTIKLPGSSASRHSVTVPGDISDAMAYFITAVVASVCGFRAGG
jgi:hypothetical protein